MPSFQERFCAAHRCTEKAFAQKVFWLCLHRRAVLVAPLLGGFRAEYFAADRELIAAAGRAADLKDIIQEIRDFYLTSSNRGWWRRRAKIRVSAQRLLNLARPLLAPASTSCETTPV